MTEGRGGCERGRGAALAEIRATGAGLAIDDFGTGLSSLSQLKDIPFDTVKIDRSFLALHGSSHEDGDGAVILGSIVNLAHELGRVVVVEGVESEQDVARLKEMGCEFAQGFITARRCRAPRRSIISHGIAAWRRSQARPAWADRVDASIPILRSAAAHLPSNSGSKSRFGIGVAMDPAIAAQFVFDLAGIPAGIAQRKDRPARAVAVSHRAKNFHRRRQRDVVGDGQGGVVAVIIATVENEAAAGFHGPAIEDRHVRRARCRGQFQLFHQVGKM